VNSQSGIVTPAVTPHLPFAPSVALERSLLHLGDQAEEYRESAVWPAGGRLDFECPLTRSSSFSDGQIGSDVSSLIGTVLRGYTQCAWCQSRHPLSSMSRAVVDAQLLLAPLQKASRARIATRASSSYPSSPSTSATASTSSSSPSVSSNFSSSPQPAPPPNLHLSGHHFYRNKVVERYAEQKSYPISLRQLLFFGRRMDRERILKGANFVHLVRHVRPFMP
jgi:hypothetical protein